MLVRYRFALRLPLLATVLASASCAGPIETEVDARPWRAGYTCTEIFESADGKRTYARGERDAYGRLTRFEQDHNEHFDGTFSGLRRVYRNDGTIVETRVEANADESARDTVVYRRDAARRIVSEKGPSTEVRYRYDEAGRLVEATYPLLRNVTRVVHPDERHLELWSGRLGVDPTLVTSVTLDERGRTIEIVHEPGAEGQRTRLVRDAAGHVHESIDEQGGGIVSRERCTLDALGRAVSCEWDHRGDGSVDSTRTIRYDARYGDHPCGIDGVPDFYPIDW